MLKKWKRATLITLAVLVLCSFTVLLILSARLGSIELDDKIFVFVAGVVSSVIEVLTLGQLAFWIIAGILTICKMPEKWKTGLLYTLTPIITVLLSAALWLNVAEEKLGTML